MWTAGVGRRVWTAGVGGRVWMLVWGGGCGQQCGEEGCGQLVWCGEEGCGQLVWGRGCGVGSSVGTQAGRQLDQVGSSSWGLHGWHCCSATILILVGGIPPARDS